MFLELIWKVVVDTFSLDESCSLSDAFHDLANVAVNIERRDRTLLYCPFDFGSACMLSLHKKHFAHPKVPLYSDCVSIELMTALPVRQMRALVAAYAHPHILSAQMEEQQWQRADCMYWLSKLAHLLPASTAREIEQDLSQIPSLNIDVVMAHLDVVLKPIERLAMLQSAALTNCSWRAIVAVYRALSLDTLRVRAITMTITQQNMLAQESDVYRQVFLRFFSNEAGGLADPSTTFAQRKASALKELNYVASIGRRSSAIYERNNNRRA